MRYPWRLVLPATACHLASQCRYAASRGWLVGEPRVWVEVLGRLPLALWHRKAVSERAVKIAIAVNRFRVADPKAVWELGRISWREILCGGSGR